MKNMYDIPVFVCNEMTHVVEGVIRYTVSKRGQQGSSMLMLHIREWALFFSPLCWNFGAITVRSKKLLMLIKAQSLKMPSSAPRLASWLLMYCEQKIPTECRRCTCRLPRTDMYLGVVANTADVGPPRKHCSFAWPS